MFKWVVEPTTRTRDDDVSVVDSRSLGPRHELPGESGGQKTSDLQVPKALISL